MTSLPPPHHSTSPTCPLPGLLAALPSSLLLRRAGTRPPVYWGVTAALASSFALLSLLPSYGAQLCAALIFGPIRCLQWACYFQVRLLSSSSHPLAYVTCHHQLHVASTTTSGTQSVSPPCSCTQSVSARCQLHPVRTTALQLLADERRYPPHLTGRALGYNNSLIALLGDLLPYLLTFLAASDGWGGDLNGRYLRIKVRPVTEWY